MASHYSDSGPVAAVHQWVDSVIAEDFGSVWLAMDDNLRLCRAQAWVWNNRTHPYFVDADLEAEVQRLVALPSTGPIWDDFAMTELEQLLETWDDLLSAHKRGDVGAASATRVIGPDLEVVILMDTGGKAVVFDGPTLIDDAFVFSVRMTEDGWRLTAYSDFVPVPGLPPQLEPPTD